MLWPRVAPAREGMPVLTAGPVPHVLDWLHHVNEPQTEKELERWRECIRRPRPYGNEIWPRQIAAKVNLGAL